MPAMLTGSLENVAVNQVVSLTNGSSHFALTDSGELHFWGNANGGVSGITGLT